MPASHPHAASTTAEVACLAAAASHPLHPPCPSRTHCPFTPVLPAPPWRPRSSRPPSPSSAWRQRRRRQRRSASGVRSAWWLRSAAVLCAVLSFGVRCCVLMCCAALRWAVHVRDMFCIGKPAAAPTPCWRVLCPLPRRMPLLAWRRPWRVGTRSMCNGMQRRGRPGRTLRLLAAPCTPCARHCPSLAELLLLLLLPCCALPCLLQEKAEAVRRKQMKHVLFTIPEVVRVRPPPRPPPSAFRLPPAATLPLLSFWLVLGFRVKKLAGGMWPCVCLCRPSGSPPKPVWAAGLPPHAQLSDPWPAAPCPAVTRSTGVACLHTHCSAQPVRMLPADLAHPRTPARLPACRLVRR